MKKPSFDEMTAFCEVALQGSYSKAADHLGVSRSALSHVIKGLEKQVGAQLLRRTTRSVSLTEAGESLLGGLLPLLNEFEQLLADVSKDSENLQGEIRINGSEGAISYLLENVIPEFRLEYPSVHFDLVSDGHFIDIVEQKFDIGIRLGDAVQKDMIALPIGPLFRFITVASPKYLKDNGVPVSPHKLSEHKCIRQRLPSGKRYNWEFSKKGKTATIDVPGTISLNNNTLMVQAALQGLGIVYLPEAYAEKYILEGKLLRVLDDWCPADNGLFLYFPKYRHMSKSLRVFIDFIKAKAVR